MNDLDFLPGDFRKELKVDDDGFGNWTRNSLRDAYHRPKNITTNTKFCSNGYSICYINLRTLILKTLKELFTMNINQEKKQEAAANHKASIASSLKRRIESARANNNAGLVEVLQSEMKQLGLG